MLQIGVAAVVDLRLDPRLLLACLLLPISPLAHWLISALAAIFAQTPGLFRGPREKRVVWDLPRSES
ncbi:MULTISPECIES: hypothetical protein [unclassified Streptomyces]|uniref:hypothetical protein n=1 Tax=unclassified Streptomyces TaxID=2593676 RepID=UPI00037A2845|nr:MULTISPECIES: hypothetical protein [unclassified Streptomyces]